MDGVELLGLSRTTSPDTVRVLFTGQPDMDKAIAAGNQGAIFRFVTKPCPRLILVFTLNAAIAQHELITAQRVLLEQTLNGSIKALTDILALASPLAFGQATRLRSAAAALASAAAVTDAWQLETAAALAQIGCGILPPAVLEKVREGQSLTSDEEVMMERVPAVVETVLANIPRLEGVRDIVRYQAKRFDGSGNPPDKVSGQEIPWGARALKLIVDADRLESEGLSPSLAFDTLRGRTGWYDPEILETLAKVRKVRENSLVRELPLAGLRPGMVLAQDVRTRIGALFIARGQEVTSSLLEKFRYLVGAGLGAEAVRVIVPAHPDT